MKSNRVKLFIILLLLPVVAYAHGEDILAAFFAQIASIFAVLIFLALVKATPKTKALLLITYIITSTITFFSLLGNYGEYLRHFYSINIVIALLPLASVLIVFTILQYKNKIRNSQN